MHYLSLFLHENKPTKGFGSLNLETMTSWAFLQMD